MENASPSPGARAKPTGLLPVSVTERTHPASGVKQTSQKPMRSKQKVVVRRLPPGLTQQEFERSLGENWKANEKKFSWVCFKQGKVSKDPSKPSVPSRAYLQLTEPGQFEALASKVRSTQFCDEQRTWMECTYPGPPITEYAPYDRVPPAKRRHDARLGTIDQDPEFINFLESLTSPIVKAAVQDSDSIEKSARVSSTPLIQYLREKKAAKEKGLATSKAAKQSKQSSRNDNNAKTENRGGDAKAESTALTNSNSSSKSESTGSRKSKPLPAKTNPADNKNRGQVQNVQKPVDPSTDTTTEESRRRGSEEMSNQNQVKATSKRTSANPRLMNAASVIQRDLGLGVSANQKRRGTQQNNNSIPKPEKDKDKEPPKDSSSISAATPDSKQSKSPEKGTANASSSQKASENITSKSTTAKPPQKANPTQSIVPKTPRAFLKHANPSQGITEPLITEALSTFGTVKSVEIDKRKGFAYADFTDTESLRMAIAASPIKIAQGSIQVLERREKSGQGNAAHKGPTSAPVDATAPKAAKVTAAQKNVAQPQPSPTIPTDTKDPSSSTPTQSGRGRAGGHRGQGGRSRIRGGSVRGATSRTPGADRTSEATQTVSNERATSKTPILRAEDHY